MDPISGEIAALIALHRGLDRKGPGDTAFSRTILESLPPLPETACIADLGCGCGVATLLLASYFPCHIKAVDLASEFLDELMARAREAGVGHRIEPLEQDFGCLGWPDASVDLLWSEGAAYTLGFEVALKTWWPLLVPGAMVVVSELTLFSDCVPDPVRAFWHKNYPSVGTETENRARAVRAGYLVREVKRLPSSAWWANYYGPLKERMKQVKRGPVMDAVLRDTEEEMALFEAYSDAFGYTFYILQKD